MAFGHHPTLLAREEDSRHRRHVERALDAVFGQQVENPGDPDPVAELAPGKAADRLAAVPQIAGLVGAVEPPGHRATRTAGPFGGPQPPPGADAIDDLAPLFFRPLPRFEVHLGNTHAIVLFVNPLIGALIGEEPAERTKQMVGAVRFELTTLSTPC